VSSHSIQANRQLDYPPIIWRLSLLDEILTSPLVFVGGKGGVGKTTTASALALIAADRGSRCLLVSTDPAHSLADLFGQPIGNTETAIAAGLWALEIDPDRQADTHLAAVKARMKRLVHPRSYSEIDRQLSFARHAPGTMEAAMLERVAEVMAMAPSTYDHIIFDTAPTGHTIRLLSLPEIMAAWTDGLLSHRKKSERLSSALRHLGGGKVRGDDLSLIDAATDHKDGSRDAEINELLQARRRKLVQAREQLLDRTITSFMLVLNPDRLSLLETMKACNTLTEFSIPLAGLVVNRVLPENADGSFIKNRRQQEAHYLEDIERVFGHLPKVRVSLQPGDVHDINALRRIGQIITRGETFT